MKLENWKKPAGYYCQRELPESLTVEAIKAALPGIKKGGPSKDGKSDHEFRFLANGEQCAIWRWKGGSWSSYGPERVFVQLGLLPAE